MTIWWSNIFHSLVHKSSVISSRFGSFAALVGNMSRLYWLDVPVFQNKSCKHYEDKCLLLEERNSFPSCFFLSFKPPPLNPEPRRRHSRPVHPLSRATGAQTMTLFSIPIKPDLTGEAADPTTWAQISYAALNLRRATCSVITAGQRRGTPRRFRCTAASANMEWIFRGLNWKQEENLFIISDPTGKYERIKKHSEQINLCTVITTIRTWQY